MLHTEDFFSNLTTKDLSQVIPLANGYLDQLKGITSPCLFDKRLLFDAKLIVDSFNEKYSEVPFSKAELYELAEAGLVYGDEYGGEWRLPFYTVDRIAFIKLLQNKFDYEPDEFVSIVEFEEFLIDRVYTEGFFAYGNGDPVTFLTEFMAQVPESGWILFEETFRERNGSDVPEQVSKFEWVSEEERILKERIIKFNKAATSELELDEAFESFAVDFLKRLETMQYIGINAQRAASLLGFSPMINFRGVQVGELDLSSGDICKWEVEDALSYESYFGGLDFKFSKWGVKDRAFAFDGDCKWWDFIAAPGFKMKRIGDQVVITIREPGTMVEKIFKNMWKLFFKLKTTEFEVKRQAHGSKSGRKKELEKRNQFIINLYKTLKRNHPNLTKIKLREKVKDKTGREFGENLDEGTIRNIISKNQ